MRLLQFAALASLLISPLLHANEYFGPTNLSGTKADTIKITGPADLKNTQAERITVIGPLRFENIIVSQQLKIVGPVEGSKGDINQLDCMGWASLKNTKVITLNVTGRLDATEIEVKDQSNIVGVLDAFRSKFKDITIVSSLATLKNSSVHMILIQQNKAEKEAPVIKLLDSSTVHGDIVFESQNGKVIIDKSSTFNGTVKGGEIQQLQ